MLGEKLSNVLRTPTADESIRKMEKAVLSKYPLRTLGYSIDDGSFLTEEERASHIHIIGTTREGKSSFLELLIRQDIDNGYGCTLLDPSDNGDTALKVLKYCASIGYDKVCIIDPHDFATAIPQINPLHYSDLPDGNVEMIMESLRVLWGGSFEDTARIQTYLPALLHVLHKAKATIPDAVYFSSKDDPALFGVRNDILSHTPRYDNSRVILQEVFFSKSQLAYTEFKSSIRRLNPFFTYLPKRMYGTGFPPIDFTKLVSDKWVILVNLYRGKLWGEPQQRILGTLAIMEIISAFMTLERTAWKGRHYLYIDEAGQFATKVLSDIMAYKGKSGLWATASHQYYDQFEDKKILSAIENLTKIKVAFYTPNQADRRRIAKDLFYGEMADREAVDALGKLPKQEAYIKIGKEDTSKVRIAEVFQPEVSAESLGQFKEKIYQRDYWYRTLNDINQHFDVRHPASDKPAAPSEFRGGDSGRDNRKANPESTKPRTPDVAATNSDVPPVRPARKFSRDIFAKVEEGLRVSKDVPEDQRLAAKKPHHSKGGKPDKVP